MNSGDLNIVNVVAGGDLGRQIDLGNVHEDINGHETEYEPEHFAGLITRFQDPKATVMMFTSGKYNIAGCKSYSYAKAISRKFVSIVESVVGEGLNNNDFEYRFVVCVADLAVELDLNKVMMTLGIENVEYEPEQFPALFYRPENQQWFALLFRTGKIVIEGGPELEVLENGYEKIIGELEI